MKETIQIYSHQNQTSEKQPLISRRTIGLTVGAVIGGAIGLAVEEAKPENRNTRIGRGKFVAKTMFFVLSGMFSGLIIADNNIQTP